ncbi:MAG: hypothetical protein ACRC8S_00335 [Fimbriiglobus sp.]
MAQKPQSRLIRGIIAAHMGLSVMLYFLSYITPLTPAKIGYQLLAEVLRNLDQFYWQLGVWANLMWFLSIVCYFSKHRLGQLLFAAPGIVTLIASIVHIQNGKQTWLLAPWLWAISMLLAFYAGLINYHPRPQTLTDEDA